MWDSWTRVLQRPCPRELTTLPPGSSLQYIPIHRFLGGNSLELFCKGQLTEVVCSAMKAAGAAGSSEELLVQALETVEMPGVSWVESSVEQP